MLKDIVWNIFLKTGDIDSYLCYKKIVSEDITKHSLTEQGEKQIT